MWHFLSDKDIAELYEIPTYKVKKRRRDFNIKPITSAIDRIERELCGREDWLEEELKSVLPFEYNNGNIPHTNFTPLNSEKEFLYMKETGIVIRIDDLGRVVVPKEIRRTLRIREGDPLEIFTDRQGEIILKKYSPIGELSIFAKDYAESLANTLGCTVCITDHDQIVAASGYGKKDLQDKYISKRLESVIEGREQVLASSGEKKYVPVTEENIADFTGQVVCPIICEGDVLGSVVLLERNEKKKMGEAEQKLAVCAANFLGRQMEQ